MKYTKGVEMLLGNPRKAILKLSVPMMIGMSVQVIYNLVDAMWVSGLGNYALAAVGIFMPFMMILMAIAAGVGIGGSSAISRAIGERNRDKASNIAEHSIIVGVSMGVLLSIPMLIFLPQIFERMGATAETTLLGVQYGRIILLGSVFIFLSNIGGSILRGEGDTKRAMYGMVVGAFSNMILDPIFIYYLGMGVEGAAVATILSIILSTILLFYWLMIKKDTFVKLNIRYFKFDGSILKEIMKVGMPSSLSQLSMSLAMIFLNFVVLRTGGDYGMAVFASGWRIVMIGAVPVMGMAAAVTSVVGAAYGARDAAKLEDAYTYAIKIGVIMEMIIGFLIYIFAPQITYIFTYSESSMDLSPGIVEFLRTIVFFFPVIPFGMFTSSMFQGSGMGMRSLAVTVLRTLGFQVVFAYLLGIVLQYGLQGVWIGIVAGNMITAIITFVWGRFTVKHLKKEWYADTAANTG